MDGEKQLEVEISQLGIYDSDSKKYIIGRKFELALSGILSKLINHPDRSAFLLLLHQKKLGQLSLLPMLGVMCFPEDAYSAEKALSLLKALTAPAELGTSIPLRKELLASQQSLKINFTSEVMGSLLRLVLQVSFDEASHVGQECKVRIFTMLLVILRYLFML